MHRVAGRLFSPLGFVIVGLFFTLPFVTASCTAQAGTFKFSYTGVDLATGRRPRTDPNLYVLASRGDSRQTPAEVDAQIRQALHPLATQWTVTVTFVIVALGVLAVLIPRPRVRAATGMFLALAGAAVLMVAALVAEQSVYRRFAADTKSVMAPESPGSYLRVNGDTGLWLAVGLLMVIFVTDGWHLARLSRPPKAQPEPAGEQPKAPPAPAGEPPKAEPASAGEPP